MSLLIQIHREGKNDNDIVIDMCREITSMLPQKIAPVFAKGKHLKFAEAIEKLKEKLGIIQNHADTRCINVLPA